jgi:hypothetical protein
MHDLIGCNKESCDRNNKKENQILDECKTIKTEITEKPGRYVTQSLV